MSGSQCPPPAPRLTELAHVDISHAPQEAPPAEEVNKIDQRNQPTTQLGISVESWTSLIQPWELHQTMLTSSTCENA